MPRNDRPRATGESLTPPEWFEKLYRASVGFDAEDLEEAWDALYEMGWEVSHRGFHILLGLPTERCYRPDKRPPVRIWGFAPLAGLTIKDLCERISNGDVPPPQSHDELGPLWDRGVVDRWIKRRGLDK